MRTERLVFTLQRQLSPQDQPAAAAVSTPFGWPGQLAGSSLQPAHARTTPLDNSIVYLGETCVFDVTLSNQGAPVSALTLKVECSVEGGSTLVLHDNSQSPLQQLPFNAQEQLRVQTDIKEQGLITIVASAVFTDQLGERKYHVQFFKFNSASPVSVRTRVRHLPHTITAGAASGSSSSSHGCSVGKTRCFLEVNVQNSTQLVMQLHAVRLLAAPGVAAQQVAPLSSNPQQQQQQQAPTHTQRQRQQQQQQGAANSHQQDQQQQQQQVGSIKGCSHSQLAPAGAARMPSRSDIELLQDSDSDLIGSTSGAAAPSAQHKQQQHHQHPQLNYDQSQQQQQHALLPGQSSFAPFPSPEQQQQQSQQQVVPLPAGCSHNSLWQIDHHLSGSTGSSSATGVPPAPAPPPAAAAGASGPSSTGSSSSSTLGRLELHWSTCDGRTGRLLTQPLTGPVPASGKEVLMQLHRVTQEPPAAAAGLNVAAGPQQLATSLAVAQPFTATFTLTAGPHDMGPLLVLYTTTVPLPTAGSSMGGAAGGGGSSAQLATDSSSIQARKLGGGAVGEAGSDSSWPEVVVQGSRSRRIAGLAAGQSIDVPFELLPLRCGWLRLPTFVVASEADGRLLDGVHDVHILVV